MKRGNFIKKFKSYSEKSSLLQWKVKSKGKLTNFLERLFDPSSTDPCNLTTEDWNLHDRTGIELINHLNEKQRKKLIAIFFSY